MGKELTLGSLFDGSGGFPLAGMMAGITPVWASEIEPNCIRVTKKRIPQMKHYGDVSKVHGGKIEPVDIITFGSPCFPAGTLVLTDTGYTEIEKLTVGMKVLTHRGRWRNVTDVGSKVGETVILKGNHYGLECTPNHPIYSAELKRRYPAYENGARSKERYVGEDKEWIPAENMLDRLWAVPNSFEPLPVSPPRYAGDKKEKSLAPMDEDFFYFTGRQLGDNKELPSWAYGMKKSYRKALLRGVLDSDGYMLNDNTYKILSISKKLAHGLRLLAETLGYLTTVYYHEPSAEKEIEGRTVNQRPYYTVQITKSKTVKKLCDDTHSWYRVRSIKPTGEIKRVYNITVEEDNSYIADGIVVHNCQDLSLAGRRSGLDGAKSSMFFHAVRVIKEMREATNGKYPRWIVWENVPGALSSTKGQDFRTVLEQIVQIKDEAVHIPMLEKKWPTAGEIVGDDYTVAYRILDAQFFGVPQRRRRIFLVADFGGESAGKILFESEGLFRDFTKERGAWKSIAADAEKGIGASGGTTVLNDRGGQRMDVTENITSTLRARANHPPVVMEQVQAAGFCTEHSAKARSVGYEEEKSPTLRSGVVPAALAIENHPADSRVKISENGIVQTLTNRIGTGGGNVPIVMNERQQAHTVSENIANTLTGTDYKGTQCVFENHSQDTRYRGPLDVAQTVSATYGMGGNNQPFVVSEDEPQTLKIRCERNSGDDAADNTESDIKTDVKAYGICAKDSNAMKSDNPNSGIYEADTSRTIDRSGINPGNNQGGIAVVEAYSLQGSMIGRKDENGPNGSGINKEVSFTLNTMDRHAAVYALDRAAFNQGQNAKYDFSVDDEKAQTIVAQGPGAVASFYPQMKAESQCFREDDISNTLVNGTNPGYQNGIVEPTYTVRRLTTLECCRLQGFPDYWCDDLVIENPTEEDIAEWAGIFETYRHAIDPSKKPKSRNQIIKWLQSPPADSAIYSMWGNGVCLPIVFMVLYGMKWAAEKDSAQKLST